MKRSRNEPHRRYRETERNEIVTEYKTSGLSQASIASRHGISATTLQNWLRARREAQSEESSPKLLPVRIVPGNGEDASPFEPAFEITLKSRRRLRVPSGFDPKEVRLLVGILEETC